ncbi:MAG: phenylalanine 4-monooxygenase [Gammaproteobacteria bacterium RIFCSPHIGHO2_12_FULL_41_15]|nr:MAG: phenylalanine 4-monooxygenase [Gammaproteobacteria bacterium RIFCSPHIGHO2_12_FULL_41_15]
MSAEFNYVAKQPDAEGYIAYTDSEHLVWKTLYDRQIKAIQKRACDEYINGLEMLNISSELIPQCKTLSDRLKQLTGWSVVPVEALISFEKFFELLSNKCFPAASFIRVPEELDYLKEPDIFHEIFGHCPMLTNQAFADFTQSIGCMGKQFSQTERVLLARLYWFTVEFGLLNTTEGLRIYGGGILSSIGETQYALESDQPKRQPFDLLTVLRTPYRYDEMQLNYFVINDFYDLYALANAATLKKAFNEAIELGLLPNPHKKQNDETRSC